MLSIAGSDPSGGAGIQADIKTACALGVYAMTAITAVTAQNTCGVRGFEPVSPAMLENQLSAIEDDVLPDVVKVGMLPDSRSVEIVASFLERHTDIPAVIDPVLVATSGDSLSSGDTLGVMRERLFPHATLLTPNIPEAESISGAVIRGADSFPAVAEQIIDSFGCHAVLLKGGHGGGDILTDFFLAKSAGKRMELEFPHPKIMTRNTHGTGCTLSSAIASLIAVGKSLPEAVRDGIAFLHDALSEGSLIEFGKGHGPVNHIFNTLGK